MASFDSFVQLPNASRRLKVGSLGLLLVVAFACSPPFVGNSVSGVMDSFGPWNSLGVGADPLALASPDLDGDGRVDLVTANYAAGTVSILIANGDGSFAPAREYAAGSTPIAVAAADLDRDGRSDLVVANYFAGTVGVLRAMADGGFSLTAQYSVGARPRCVAIGDVDGDGRPDLAVGDYGSNTVSVLLGNGDGSFQPRLVLATGLRPSGIVIARMNGDVLGDIVVANLGSKTVSIFTATGGGGFGTRNDHALGTGPTSLAIADVNQDQALDVIVGMEGNEVGVLPGLGDGRCSLGIGYAVGLYPRSVAAGDIDGDGDVDLVSANGNGASVSILLQDCAGFHVRETDIPVLGTPYAVVLAPLDSDSKLDIAVACTGTNRVSVSRNQFPTPIPPEFPLDFALPRAVSVPYYSTGVQLGDFNRDGNADLAYNFYESAQTSVVLGDGTGRFGPRLELASEKYASDLAVADLNRDGCDDLAIANWNEGALTVQLATCSGGFAPRVSYPIGPSAGRMAVVDADGDGWKDLASVGYHSSKLTILRGIGAGDFGSRIDVEVGEFPGLVRLADLNHDSHPDVIVSRGNGSSVSILMSHGDMTFGPRVDYPIPWIASALVPADLDRDGHIDLALVVEPMNIVVVLLGRGDGTFRPGVTYPTGSRPFSLAVADVDGDAVSDLCLTQYWGFQCNHIGVLLGRGDGTFRSRMDFTAGFQPRDLAVGDVDHDGRPDIAVAGLYAQLLINRTPPLAPTATVLERFRALRIDTGFRIEWIFHDPELLEAIHLERGSVAADEWQLVAAEPSSEGALSVVEDHGGGSASNLAYRLRCVSRGGDVVIFGPIPVEAGEPLGTAPSLELAPNPAAGRTAIHFTVPKRADVRVTLIDVQGREASVLSEGTREAGHHTAMLEAGQLTAGLYFVRVYVGPVSITKRLVIVR